MKIFLFFAACLVAFANTALADCTSPAGVQGSIDYNNATGVRSICDGTSWKVLEVINTSGTSARTLLNMDNDTGACDGTKMGRIKFVDGGPMLQVCNGTTWTDLSEAIGTPSLSFIDLDDVTGSMAGQGSKYLRVNSAGTSIEYVDGLIRSVSGAAAPTSTFGYWTLSGSEIYYNSGNVGIGVADPTVALDVSGDIHYTGVLQDVSDRRLKENIIPLGSGHLEKLGKLQAVSFSMKSDPHAERELGLIAQDVQAVYPELVSVTDDEQQTLTLNYIGLIGPLIESIKELKSENDALKARIEALENRP